MHLWSWANGGDTPPTAGGSLESAERLLADGGHDEDEDEPETASDSGESDAGDDETPGVNHSSVEVAEEGEVDPVDPKWQKPDPDDIPEVEGPKTRPADSNRAGVPSGDRSGEASSGGTAADAGVSDGRDRGGDPTAGMPNTARSPGTSRLREGGADGYVSALELCARLPEDIRLPEEAADLVPVAFEAELEQTVQQFAGEQFDNPSPHVETLDFVEVDGEIWLRLRLGVPSEAFADLDPDEIREHALQKLEGML